MISSRLQTTFIHASPVAAPMQHTSCDRRPRTQTQTPHAMGGSMAAMHAERLGFQAG
jgi:hypothetical protein